MDVSGTIRDEKDAAMAETTVEGRTSLDSWIKRSVWSYVLALELGLIREPQPLYEDPKPERVEREGKRSPTRRRGRGRGRSRKIISSKKPDKENIPPNTASEISRSSISPIKISERTILGRNRGRYNESEKSNNDFEKNRSAQRGEFSKSYVRVRKINRFDTTDEFDSVMKKFENLHFENSSSDDSFRSGMKNLASWFESSISVRYEPGITHFNFEQLIDSCNDISFNDFLADLENTNNNLKSSPRRRSWSSLDQPIDLDSSKYVQLDFLDFYNSKNTSCENDSSDKEYCYPSQSFDTSELSFDVSTTSESYVNMFELFNESTLDSCNELTNESVDSTLNEEQPVSLSDSRDKPKKRKRNDTKIVGEKRQIYYDSRKITRSLTKINRKNFVGKLVWGSCAGWWPAVIVKAEHVGMIETPGKVWVYWISESKISSLSEKTQVEPFSSNLKSRINTENASLKKIQAINMAVQLLRKKFDYPLRKPYYSWIEKNCNNLTEIDELKFYPYFPEIQQKLDELKELNYKATEKYIVNMNRQSPERTKKSPTEKVKENSLEDKSDFLPLMEQKPGIIAWGKIAGHNWWPAMIIDNRDCSMREPNFGCQWLMWYGDYKLSQIHHSAFMRFDKGVYKMREYTQQTKKSLYLNGVLYAAKDYCRRLGVKTENWVLPDVFKWFAKNDTSCEKRKLESNSQQQVQVEKYSSLIERKLNELKVNHIVVTERKHNIKNSESLKLIMSEKEPLEKLCMMCLKISNESMEEHPFFTVYLCKKCSELFKPRVFVFGDDGKCFYCTLCAGFGTVVMCSKEECPRVYCTACLKYLICPDGYNEILFKDPWECFLCSDESQLLDSNLITTHLDWKERLVRMFRKSYNTDTKLPEQNNQEKRKIRVLSLFDGLSTGYLVLQKLNIEIDCYYASEIDEDALMVSSSHYGNQIVQLGDVRNITEEIIRNIVPIDLIIGGSPCNDLSLANPGRLGLHDKNGTGILFFEYCRLLKIVKKLNKGRHVFWLYENVASMPSKYRLEINKHLGREPDLIDSADFSPQHRLRLYWHNLPAEPYRELSQNEQDVQDVLTPNCNRFALVKKIRTVTTRVNSLKQGKLALKPILMKDESDSIWITELEEIFGFPRHYTDVKNLSATKRQKLIGKSWSVQTLIAVLRPLRSFFIHSDDVE